MGVDVRMWKMRGGCVEDEVGMDAGVWTMSQGWMWVCGRWARGGCGGEGREGLKGKGVGIWSVVVKYGVYSVNQGVRSVRGYEGLWVWWEED